MYIPTYLAYKIMVVDEDMKKYVVVDPMKKLIKKEGNCVVWLS